MKMSIGASMMPAIEGKKWWGSREQGLRLADLGCLMGWQTI